MSCVVADAGGASPQDYKDEEDQHSSLLSLFNDIRQSTSRQAKTKHAMGKPTTKSDAESPELIHNLRALWGESPPTYYRPPTYYFPVAPPVASGDDDDCSSSKVSVLLLLMF